MAGTQSKRENGWLSRRKSASSAFSGRFIGNLLLTALAGLVSLACEGNLELSQGFPTPPPNPRSTPLISLKLTSDSDLETRIADIAKKAGGKVGVAAILLETGDFAGLNADQQFPMQSVYKLPIAMAVIDQVNRGELELDGKVGVSTDDMVRSGMRSPLRDKNPNGGEFNIRELIGLALVESDGTASDVLIQTAGGTANIQAFLIQIGIRDITVANPEKEIGRDWLTQYENWATPSAAVELLRWLGAAGREDAPAIMRSNPNGAVKGEAESRPGIESDQSPHFSILLRFLADSNPGANRLKGLLPKGTVVEHKTGTSGTREGMTAATNDIGILTLPNGNHIAIAVFVSDSPKDEKTRELVIAGIAKAVWDRWQTKPAANPPG